MPRADLRQFVFLAATAYDVPTSGRTRRLAEVLAARGHSVVFAELPVARNAPVPFVRAGARSVSGSSIRVIRLYPLPGFVRLRRTRLARWWASHSASRLSRLIQDLDQSIVVTSTPRWFPVLQALPCALQCYDYIDHISVQAGLRHAAVFADWDEELLCVSHIVTTVSHSLREYLIPRFCPARIFLIPNGVPGRWLNGSVEAVPRSRLTPHSERRIVGFLGSLFEWIDRDLLIRTARLLPEMEFVLVGPRRRGVDLKALLALPNVRWKASVPFSAVPEYIKTFDVCIIPFKRNIAAECADPLKLYEYCALGKPVVSTVRFRTDGRPAPIVVCDTADGFASAIATAAVGDTPAKQAERLAFAREHTWEKRVDAFTNAVEKGLRVLGDSAGAEHP